MGASSVQIVPWGGSSPGSSSAPARTISKWGRAFVLLNSGVPQVGQKPRRIALPLSAIESYQRTSPSTATLSLGKTTLTVALPAANDWQSLHQHRRVSSGSAAALSRTAPHRHPPS